MPDRVPAVRRVARSTPARWAAVAVVVAALVATWTLTRSSATGYRTATAAPATVSQTVSAVGTIQPLDQDTLAFGTAGVVASVPVAVGQQVAAGQVVATLAAAPLQQALDAAQASLASAQAKLAADEAAQAATSAGTSTGAAASTASMAGTAGAGGTAAASLVSFVPGGGTTPGTGSTGSTGGSTGSTSISTAQADLVAAQHRLDAAEATESTDLAAATLTCRDALVPGATTSASACTAALATVTTDQHAVETDLAAVTRAEAALAAALAAATTTPSTPTSRPTTTTTTAGAPAAGRVSSPGSTGSTGPATGGATAPSVTPEQVAVDQADVDQAQVQVDSAQTDLAAATLATPMAGTVAAVGLTTGQSVAAGSTSATIVVLAPGSYQATVEIPVASIGAVATGQHAEVVPDATDGALAGTVAAIGALPTSASGTTVYPVTIALGPAGLPLNSGGSAEVTIVVRTATAEVTVPTSAVHTFGSRHVVDRLVNGTPVATVVGVGVVGPVRTQVTSGLGDGAPVVLADLSAPLPSSTSSPGLVRAIAGGGFGARAGRGGALGGG